MKSTLSPIRLPTSGARRRLLIAGAAALPWPSLLPSAVAQPQSNAPAQAPAKAPAKAPAQAQAAGLTPVTFATNWRAQAAHGGFYQAVADGTYQRLGLQVTIQQGGPSVNNRPLLPAGRIDFLMTGNLLHSFDNVRNKVPTVVVAAMFQKDPQALMAHPGQGLDAFEALRTSPVAFVAKDAQFTWWQWLKTVHGFRDEQLKPYQYNLGPWLANRRSVQQAYAVAEPIYAERQGGFKPVVHLLADHGFSTYSTLIEARRDMVQRDPDRIRRFVEGSILGWTRYLHGDRRAANALMMKDNPDMTEAELEASVGLMKRLGIVESAETGRLGIGCMRRDRVADFLDQMTRAGLYKAGQVDPSAVLVEDFVNRGIGVELRQQLQRAPG